MNWEAELPIELVSFPQLDLFARVIKRILPGRFLPSKLWFLPCWKDRPTSTKMKKSIIRTFLPIPINFLFSSDLAGG